MSQRIHKVNEYLQHELSQLILEEPVAENNFLTITQVLTAPDLRQAVVWISALDKTKGAAAVEVLNKQSHNFFQPLSDRLRTKHIPQLIFKLDEESGSEAKIDAILDSIDGQQR
jgi:ribosome-binding factor A